MDYFLQVSVRSTLLAAVAALGLWRVKSAAVRHAVWTLVTVSMLAQIALSPVLPEIPLRVLAAPVPVAISVTKLVIPDVAIERPPSASWSWEELAGAIYLCGLLFFVARFVIALRFAQRLARASEPAVEGAYESARIAAPVTIGNRILLPMSWRDWDSGKQQAVLAHEQAHVRRHDWAIAAMARVNRCVFWFHPLAWWLERQLARLAEQACDDAALAVVEDRELYARTLLDVARATQISGRVLSAPMAREANVETRIDRILDETRRIPKALSRRGWMALALCAAPMVYMAAAVQVAPAQTTVTVPPPPPPPAPPQIPGGVTVAPAAAVPQAPALPQPPAVQATPDVPPERPRNRSNDFGGTLGGPVYIPKIYNGQNKTFFYFSYEDYLNQVKRLQEDSDGAGALPMPVAPRSFPQLPVSEGAPLHVDVKSIRLTTISIPLDPTGQYEVSARITTLERKFVTSFDELVDHRQMIEKQIPLKPGHYRLVVLVRKDGMNSRQELEFEVE